MKQKQNSIPSAGAAADSEQKVEDTTSCQHSRKPLVVGSQSQSNAHIAEMISVAKKNGLGEEMVGDLTSCNNGNKQKIKLSKPRLVAEFNFKPVLGFFHTNAQ